MDRGGVVSVSLEVAPHHGLDSVPFEVRPGKRPRVEQHLPNVLGEGIPVPDPEMEQLVPAEEEAFEAKCGKEVIDPGQPLRHTIVICVLRLERELEETSRGHGEEASRASADTAVASNSPESRMAVADQSQANVAVRK